MNSSPVNDEPPEGCRDVPAAAQAAALIALLAREIGRDEGEAFRGSPWTPPQYAIARALAAGPLTVTELAREACCVPGNVTALVDRLEDKGLARRVADPRDRRLTRVALTAAGAGSVADTGARLTVRGGLLSEALPAGELDALVTLLGRLYVAVRRREEGAAGSAGGSVAAASPAGASREAEAAR